MNAVRSDHLFNKPRLVNGAAKTIPGQVIPRPVNFRLRNDGGFGDRWMRNPNDRSRLKANLVSDSVSTDFDSARCRSALLSSAGSRSAPGSSASRTNQNSATRSSTSKSPRTPGAATNGNDTRSITEGRGKSRGEVGIAAIDVNRPNLIVSQISDCQTYSKSLAKISIFSPVEILLPNTFCDGSTNSKLFSSIKEQFPNITITTVQRRHFSDSRGMELIRNLCVPEYSSVEVLVQNRFYALSAAAALIKYVEFLQNLIFAPKSLSIKYQGSQNTMLIDIETAKRLELVSSAKVDTNFKLSSLLGVLNHTRTIGGYRLLRATILQPPCILGDIQTRLECVEELVTNPTLFRAFQAILPKLADVERLLTLCMMAPNTGDRSEKNVEYQLNYVLLLKSSLEHLEIFRDVIASAEHPFFKSIHKLVQSEDFDSIHKSVKKLLHDDAKSVKGFSASCIQRCFAIKSEMHVLLDMARKKYCEIVDDISKLIQGYGEEYGLPLRVGHNTMKGFHIQMPVGGPNARHRNTELPKIFIQVTKTRSSFSMTSQALVNLDMRSKEMLKEIQSMSAMVLSELLYEVRQKAGCLYQLCEAVSQIDLISSLAAISSLPDHVRPTFGSKMVVKGGKHPILNNISHVEPVPNDIESTEQKNFHIITGPNMAGKSIYIRQVALMQIMAQVGCYLPAESAELRVTDRIFSRIGFEDSIEGNASTFVVEMKEMNFILQQMTPNSLIIIDELCRGTSSEEGTSIAWALCERLLCSPAFTFFTTHFLYLTRLQNSYSNVTNFCLESVEKPATRGGNISETGEGDEKWIRYTHRLIQGVMKIERYGLRLAKLSLMPPEVTEEADHILANLITARKPLPEMQSGGQAVMLYQTFRCMAKTIVSKYRDDPALAISRLRHLTLKFKKQHPNWQEEIMMAGTPLPVPQTESARRRLVSPFMGSQISQVPLPTPTAAPAASTPGNVFQTPQSEFRTPMTPRSATRTIRTPSTVFRTPKKSTISSGCSTPFSPSKIPMPTFKTRPIEEYFKRAPRQQLTFQDPPKEPEEQQAENEEVPVGGNKEPENESGAEEADLTPAPETPRAAEEPTLEQPQEEEQESEPICKTPPPKPLSPVSIQEMLRRALPDMNFDVPAPTVTRRSTVSSYSFGSASFTMPDLSGARGCETPVQNPFCMDIELEEEPPETTPAIPTATQSDEHQEPPAEPDAEFRDQNEVIRIEEDNDEVASTPAVTNHRFQLQPTPEFSCSLSFKDFLEQRSGGSRTSGPTPPIPASPSMRTFLEEFAPSSQQLETAQRDLAQKLERMRNLYSDSPPRKRRRDGSRLSQNSATPVAEEDHPRAEEASETASVADEAPVAPSPFILRRPARIWPQKQAALPNETTKQG